MNEEVGERMIIIADDLTGANDTGVQFVKRGQRTIVHLVPSTDLVMYQDKINVINTDSRALSSEEAYERNREVARRMRTDKETVIYKKIDSTLRGNIGQEIDALMDELAFNYCAVAPAYPQNGRNTIGGYHLVHGILLEDSELSKDVKFPMTESHIPTLLKGQTNRQIGLVQIKAIRTGKIAEEVKLLRMSGAEIIVFDSANEQDLQAITAFLEQEDHVLWVGSAGLAQAMSVDESKEVRQELKGGTPSQFPVLTIAGSVSNVTRKQIAFQKEQGAYQIVLHPLDLLKKNEEILEQALDEAKRLLDQKEDVVVTTELSKEAASEVEKYRTELALDYLEIGNQIAASLGVFASRLIKGVRLSGLILTGGDIAYQTCLQLEIHSLEVLQEVEEGIPLSKAADGPFVNIMIVTKAGAFGQQSSLHHAMKMIKTESK